MVVSPYPATTDHASGIIKSFLTLEWTRNEVHVTRSSTVLCSGELSSDEPLPLYRWLELRVCVSQVFLLPPTLNDTLVIPEFLGPGFAAHIGLLAIHSV